MRTQILVAGLALILFACGVGDPTLREDDVEAIAVDCTRWGENVVGLASGQELAFDGTVVATSRERNTSAAFQRGMIDDGETEDQDLSDEELAALDAEMTEADHGEDPVRGEVWPWTTFEVHGWYTRDNGTTISIWTAGLNVEVGQRWLIAGEAFATPEGLGEPSQQSGMAVVCASQPFTEAVAGKWDSVFGGAVTPGADAPEGDPDPAVVADVKAHRVLWDDSGIDSYTFSGYGYEGSDASVEGDCSPNGRIRVVVEGGSIVQAINTTETCDIPADSAGLWTIEDLFDIAERVSGADDWGVEWSESWPYPSNVFGYDRSFEVGFSVIDLQPGAVTGYFGDDLHGALLDAQAQWESQQIGDYTITIEVECFCDPNLVAPVTVMVSQGEPFKVLQHGQPMDIDDIDGFVPLTVEGLFERAEDASGGLVVGFDPDFGFPLDIYDEGDRFTIDDEVGYRVTSFEAALIDTAMPLPQPVADPAGLASDDPEVWLAEISELRASAGPGRLVGFVHLTGGTTTGVPLAGTQPFCTGYGKYQDIVPGVAVEVYGDTGELAGETILRGSAFDGHLGCVMWFGLDVTPFVSYQVVIGEHTTEFEDVDQLAAGAWMINIWAELGSLEANCGLGEDQFETCLSLTAS